MANFGQLVLTNVGIQEQYKAQTGGKLKFKRIAMGSGTYTGNILSLTKLIKENVSVAVSDCYVQNNAAMVEGFFSNDGLTTGFAWREIGLFVEDENGKEVLYCYANAGDTYDYIPATEDERYSKYIRIATAIGNATNISIVESEGILYVDTVTFKQLAEKVDEQEPTKTENGNVLFLDGSAEAPFVGMKIYGKSTQDGIPTLDAPVDIVSVGESGSVAVTVCGKNLLSAGVESKTISGVTYTVNADESITVNGTATQGSYLWCYGTGTQSSKQKHLPRGKYTLSGMTTKIDGFIIASAIRESANSDRVVLAYGDDTESESFEVTTDTALCDVLVSVSTGTTVNNVRIYPMLEAGEIGTDYEAPTNAQTLNAETPNGLRGIPVSSGGNYADANGQQWVCDEIDFERGVYVKRIGNIVLDDAKSYKINTYQFNETGKYLFECFITEMSQSASNIPAMSDRLPYAEWGSFTANEPEAKLYATSGRLIVFLPEQTIQTVEAFKEYLGTNPINALYKLETPVETPLTDAEIFAYKALHSNNPSTTILNDSGADMNVKYITKAFEPMMKDIVDRREIESTEHRGCFYKIVDGEPEWINPPMVEEVEYRTTERHNGNPVYAKKIVFHNEPIEDGIARKEAFKYGYTLVNLYAIEKDYDSLYEKNLPVFQQNGGVELYAYVSNLYAVNFPKDYDSSMILLVYANETNGTTPSDVECVVKYCKS